MLLPTAAIERPSTPGPSARAAPVRRVAHTPLADAARPACEAPLTPTAAPAHATPATPCNQDLLRDQYVHDRLHRAIKQYRLHHPICECQGADAGSIDCLLPLQPYRTAVSTPPVEMRDMPVPAAAQRLLKVSSVQKADLDEGFESMRKRRRFGAWP
jgi:hypothetical protein